MQFRGKRAFIHIHKLRDMQIAGRYLGGTPVPQVEVQRFVERGRVAIPARLHAAGQCLSHERT